MADEKGKKKARALSDFSHGGEKYQSGGLIEADVAEIKALKEAGLVDDHPSAVAHVERQKARVKAAADAALE